MRFESLLSFYTTIKEGSFTSAARKLHLTQPAVSIAIKQLEMEYGQTLLKRKSGGRFELTTVGEQVYKVVENINLEIKNLESIKQKNLKNEIAIECNTIAGFYLISLVTSKFHDIHPGIHINIKISLDPIQSILDEECDFVMLLLPNQLPPSYNANLKLIMSWEDQHEIIVPKSHPFAGKFGSKKDLVNFSYILAPRNIPYRRILDETINKQLGAYLNCIVELNNPEAVKQSVLSLNKPGIVVRSTILSELNEGTLVPITNDLDLRCQHILAYLKHNAQSDAMRKFNRYVTNVS